MQGEKPGQRERQNTRCFVLEAQDVVLYNCTVEAGDLQYQEDQSDGDEINEALNRIAVSPMRCRRRNTRSE